jgi:hypothetical protein
LATATVAPEYVSRGIPWLGIEGEGEGVGNWGRKREGEGSLKEVGEKGTKMARGEGGSDMHAVGGENQTKKREKRIIQGKGRRE